MRNKHLPLTETVYYILLSLTEPAHGYLILRKVEELSEGHIKMAAGTLYGALDNLVKLKFIHQVKSDDPRRKVYLITKIGKEVLKEDMNRMQHLIHLSKEEIEKGRL